LNTLGYAHTHLGNHQPAIDSYEQAIEEWRHLGDRYFVGVSLVSVGDVHFTVGDLDAAGDAWRQAQAILDDLGHADAAAVREKLAQLH